MATVESVLHRTLFSLKRSFSKISENVISLVKPTHHSHFARPVTDHSTKTSLDTNYSESSAWRPDTRKSFRNNHIGCHLSPQYRPPRNPIVLCHGLFGYNVIGPEKIPHFRMHYWKGIDDALRQLGCQLYTTGVPTAGSIHQRATAMKAFLDVAARGERLNFVGHSMGGLDCRYLITHLRPQRFKVLSLTTVATPHRGSPFMDWCKNALGLGYQYRHNPFFSHQSLDESTGKESAEVIPTASPPWYYSITNRFDAPAFHDLTTAQCAIFNKLTPNSPDVYYSSYAASSKIPITHTLWFTQQVVTKHEGPTNDGLVSLRSAMWGDFLGILDCHHWELVPRKLTASERIRYRQIVSQQPTTMSDTDPQSVSEKTSSSVTFDPVEFYLTLATRLHHMGF